MRVLNFLAGVLILLSCSAAYAADVEFKSKKLNASSELPPVVRAIWQNTPEKCSVGYEPEQDLIAELFGTLVTSQEETELYILPCGMLGAYNSSEIAIVHIPQFEEARILAIPSMSEKGPTADMIGPGLQWEEIDSVITSFYKGRGLGDCGGNSEISWDGTYYSGLILVEQYSKLECDGNNDEWPKVWPLQ